MNKYFKYAFVALLALWGCEFEQTEYNLGDSFVSDVGNIVLIDTLSVNTYTTTADTMVTSQRSVGSPFVFYSGKASNLVGINTYCESYFRFDPPSVIAFKNSARFDSAVFIMYVNDYYYGDTTGSQTFEVHKLLDAITVEEESQLIFNSTKFEAEEDAWLNFNVDFENNNTGEIRMKLNYEEGATYFDMAFNEDELLDYNPETTSDHYSDFHNQYKGVAIIPGNDVKQVITIFANPDSIKSPRIRIYYSDHTVNDNLYFDYPMSATPVLDNFYSYQGGIYKYASSFINNDYSKSYFADLKPDENKLASSLTNNTSLVQGKFNIQTRIEIPGIDNLYDYGIGSIIKAELEFEPVVNSFDDFFNLPQSFYFMLVDSKNRPVRDDNTGDYYLNRADNASLRVVAYLDKNGDEDDFADPYPKYKADITRFIKDEYDSKADTKNSLMLQMPQTNDGSLDYLLLGNKNHPTNSIKLKLYMSFY